jgi:hypothetical protein
MERFGLRLAAMEARFAAEDREAEAEALVGALRAHGLVLKAAGPEAVNIRPGRSVNVEELEAMKPSPEEFEAVRRLLPEILGLLAGRPWGRIPLELR